MKDLPTLCWTDAPARMPEKCWPSTTVARKLNPNVLLAGLPVPGWIKKTDLIVALIGLSIGLAAVALFVWLSRSGVNAPLQLDAKSGWREIDWPLRVDPWWPKKAFTCDGRQCGQDLTLHVRVKVGFCNCETGVADDAELDRISDFGLLASKTAALDSGEPVAVSWLKGRTRRYAIVDQRNGERVALLYGLNDRCDAVVATVLLAPGARAEDAQQTAVVRFLGSEPVLNWIKAGLGREAGQ